MKKMEAYMKREISGGERNVNHTRLVRFLLVVFLSLAALCAGMFAEALAEDPLLVRFFIADVADISDEAADQKLLAFEQAVGSGGQAKNPGAVSISGGAEESGALFTFMGWYEKGAPDETPYDFSRPVTAGLNLYARFRTDLLVTYLNGFGEPFLTKRIAPGSEIPFPSDAEMCLFTAPASTHFDHWTLNPGTRAQADVYVEPVLTSASHYVFFVSDGSQTPFQTVRDSTNAVKPPEPVRQGYDFLYWSASAGGAVFNFDAPITADTLLYAVWTPKTVDYSVVFWQEKKDIQDPGTDIGNYDFYYKYTANGVAGTGTDAILADIENAIRAQSANFPPYCEYAFATAGSRTLNGNGSTVVNVYFKRIVYNFTFALADANAAMSIRSGGTYTDGNPYSFSAKFEENILDKWPVDGVAEVTTTTKHIFQGWLVPGDDKVPFVSKILRLSRNLIPASGQNQTVTAQWLTSGMTVNLHYMFESLEGESADAVYQGKNYTQNGDYSQSLFSAGTVPFTLKMIEGYTAKTARALGKSGSTYVSISKAATDQYLFYSRNTYSLNFDAAGGTVRKVTGLDYDSIPYGKNLAAYAPQPPAMNNTDGRVYTFEGWYYDAAHLQPFDFTAATMENVNLLLFAKWSVSLYTVSVFDDLTSETPLATYPRDLGEYTGDPGDYLGGAAYQTGNAYAKGVFNGWHVAVGPGVTAPLSFEMPVNSDLSVFADWIPETYGIVYERGDYGTDVIPTSILPTDSNSYAKGVYARVLGQGLMAVRSDMVFLGWKDADGEAYYPGSLILVDREIRLTPWLSVRGDAPVSITYHANYTFDMTQAFTEPPNVSQSAITGSAVTLRGFDGVYPSPGFTYPGSWRFVGWDTVSGEMGEPQYAAGDKILASASDIDLYAVWMPAARYLIWFDPGAGTFPVSGQNVYNVLEGGFFPPGQNPEPLPPMDSTFLGWSPAFDPSVPVYADRTYTAMYAYTPPLLPPPSVTEPASPSLPRLQFVNDESGLAADGRVLVRNYEGVYDGRAHTINAAGAAGAFSLFADGNDGGYTGSADIKSSLSIFYSAMPAMAWSGAPIYKTNAGTYSFALIFTAQGYAPASIMRYMRIDPRELAVTAQHDDLYVGDAAPENSYAVQTDALEAFDVSLLSLSTNYHQGDPAGRYDIFAEPGDYGNYRISERHTVGSFAVLALPDDDPPSEPSGGDGITAGTPDSPAAPSSPDLPATRGSSDSSDSSEPAPVLNREEHFAYVKGYPDGLVRPEDNITREETAEIFYRLLTAETRERYGSDENAYGDVEAARWSNRAISTLARADVVQGYPDGNFRPAGFVTRAEFAAIAARFDKDEPAAAGAFSDVAGHWAERDILRAYELRWIEGYPDGTFRPDAHITRAEAVTLINRVLNRSVESERDMLPAMLTWPDNMPDAWYYYAVQEATNAHSYERKADGVHETWTKLVEAVMP
ncbi:MAG: S-layer homology domain-containing protein [Clostridiales Family XIII bacterium]|jgi:uncharacterized repeat protein (TIGR02543 family)|nr:S-layer homology domain-containing protein [Clostridiales Family XIII bacterium]